MDFLKRAYDYNFEGLKNNVYQFRFISLGDKEIVKIVSISPIPGKDNWYNLIFGNLESNGEADVINDQSEKNNNDYDEVLKTVFMCMLHFLKLKPNGIIAFFGNTGHKHTLYKWKISSYYDSLAEHLKIFGGEITRKVPIIEKEQTIILKNGKTRKRIIKIKSPSSITGNIGIKYIEKFNKDNNRRYHFVLIGLK